MTLDVDRLGKSREWIVNALRAEGVSALMAGYQCIHLNPLFRNRIAYGSGGFPWRGLAQGDSSVTYGPGLCPVAEDLHQRTFFGINLCAHPYTDLQIDQVLGAFRKAAFMGHCGEGSKPGMMHRLIICIETADLIYNCKLISTFNRDRRHRTETLGSQGTTDARRLRRRTYAARRVHRRDLHPVADLVASAWSVAGASWYS